LTDSPLRRLLEGAYICLVSLLLIQIKKENPPSRFSAIGGLKPSLLVLLLRSERPLILAFMIAGENNSGHNHEHRARDSIKTVNDPRLFGAGDSVNDTQHDDQDHNEKTEETEFISVHGFVLVGVNGNDWAIARN
jgi:hypothetical protein